MAANPLCGFYPPSHCHWLYMHLVASTYGLFHQPHSVAHPGYSIRHFLLSTMEWVCPKFICSQWSQWHQQPYTFSFFKGNWVSSAHFPLIWLAFFVIQESEMEISYAVFCSIDQYWVLIDYTFEMPLSEIGSALSVGRLHPDGISMLYGPCTSSRTDVGVVLTPFIWTWYV